jgi:hypothetical protein
VNRRWIKENRIALFYLRKIQSYGVWTEPVDGTVERLKEEDFLPNTAANIVTRKLQNETGVTVGGADQAERAPEIFPGPRQLSADRMGMRYGR